MANISYNRIMRKLVIGFGNLFNNITLVRYNPDGTEQERVIVPLAYATKELYVQRLQGDVDLDKKVQMTLPRMSFEMNGISYDATRKQNTNWKNFVQSDNGLISQYNPVPYNFDFSLNLYIRNIEDGTQIIEHILPYFTPDYTIKLNLVEEMGISKEIPIILNSTNYDVTYEGPRDSDTRMVIWTLNFTVKGFIFGQTSHSSRIQTSIVNVFDQDSNLLIEEVIASANTPPIIVFPPPVANAVKSIVYSATVSTIDQYARDTANGAYIEAQAAFNTANGAYIEAQAAFNTANNKVNKSGDTMTGSLILSGEGNDLKFSGGSSLVGNEANNLIKITANANNDITGVAAQSGDGGLVQLYSNGRVEIITDTGAAGALWTFSKDGSLIFPNGTIQTTAFTGYAIDNVARITAQAAFDKANTGGASSIDQYARNVANSAAANTVYIQSNLNSANANITYLFGIETQQNTNIAGVNTYSYAAYSFANNAYAYANTLGTFVNSSISSVNTYSYSAYTTANNASSNIALLQGAMVSANANVVYLQTNLNNANANISLLQGAVNSANANINYLVVINTQQNTSISAVNTFAQAAFDKANTGGGNIIDQFARDTANTAAANTVYLQGGLNVANSNTAYLLAVNTLQNTNINAVNTYSYASFSFANNAYAYANLLGTFQNSSISAVNTYSYAAFNAANTAGANTVYIQTNLNNANANIALLQGAIISANANIVYLQTNLNNANANISLLQGAMVSANANIALLQGAVSSANANIVYIQTNLNASNANIALLQGAMSSANANVVYLQTNLNSANVNIALLQGAMSSANANVVYIQTNLNAANANIALLQGAMSSANANIVYLYANLVGLNTYAYAAFAKANTGGGTTIDQFARDTANTASANTVYLQTNLNNANSNIALLQGAMSSANANITLLQGAMASANANVVYLQTNLNNANSNIALLQGAMVSANSNVALLQGAMSSANANVVYLQTNLNNANANIALLQGAMTSANANIVLSTAINNAQNANIISVQTLANTDYTTLTATAGVYGNTTYIPSITLASNGRVSSVVNTAIVFPPRYMEIIAVPAANAQVAVTNIFGIVEIPVAGTINMIRARTTTGTCNAIFNINGTSIGYVNANTSGAANTVSTAISAYAALTVDVASPTGNGLVIMVRIQE